MRYGRDPSGRYVWLKICYCLFLLGGVFSIVGQLRVCRVAVVGVGAVEFVVFFVVAIAYWCEFTVSRCVNIRYLTSIPVPCWLTGFLIKNTVALSMSHICIPFNMYSYHTATIPFSYTTDLYYHFCVRMLLYS